MASLVEDQAAGLRRLFARAREPVSVAFAGAREAAGRAGVIAGLARGLAAAGKEVIVLDENPGSDGVAAAFGLASRFDLLQSVKGDVSLAHVVLQAEQAIRLVPAARAARESGRLDGALRRALGDWLCRLQKGADFVLVDTAGRIDGEFSPLLPAPQRVLVLTAGNGAAITEAYAQIKRLARGQGCRSFEIVVSRVGGAEEAKAVFANMREVARRHLGVSLELLGCIPARGATQPACNALADALLRQRQPAAAGAAAPIRAGFLSLGCGPGGAATVDPVV